MNKSEGEFIMAKTTKITNIEELDTLQKEVALELSKLLNADVNCAGLGGADTRKFEIPVKFSDSIERFVNIEFDGDIKVDIQEQAEIHAQVFESHTFSVDKMIRRENYERDNYNK